MILVLLMLAVLGSFAQIKETSTTMHNLTNMNYSDLHGFGFRLRREPSTRAKREKRKYSFSKPIRKGDLDFIIDVNMGNPPQHVEVKLDLIYRGFYITSKEIPKEFAKENLRPVELNEYLFVPEKSSSFSQYSQFYLTHFPFLEASRASYAEDNLYISIPVLEKFKFFTVKYSVERSIMGLGMPGASVYLSDDVAQEDSTNIFEQLKTHGWASRSFFSLWIGSENSEKPGLIIFNGLNDRYIREHMYIFPLLVTGGKIGYYIKIDSLLHLEPDGKSTEIANFSMLAQLDFNSEYSVFPDEIVQRFYAPYGWSSETLHQILCQKEFARGAIGLVFSGVQFAFPFKDILPDCQKGGHYGLAPFNPGYDIVLGANFLSVLYLAFDLDNKEVGIALVCTNSSLDRKKKGIFPVRGHISGILAPLYSSQDYIDTFSMVDVDPL